MVSLYYFLFHVASHRTSVAPHTSPETSFTRISLMVPSLHSVATGASSNKFWSLCLVQGSMFRSSQCHPLMFVPSSRCCTSHLGSPCPQRAIARAFAQPFVRRSGGRRWRWRTWPYGIVRLSGRGPCAVGKRRSWNLPPKQRTPQHEKERNCEADERRIEAVLVRRLFVSVGAWFEGSNRAERKKEGK